MSGGGIIRRESLRNEMVRRNTGGRKTTTGFGGSLIFSRKTARPQRRALHPYTHSSFPSIMYALAWQSKQLMDLEYVLIRSRFDLFSGREHILTIHGCSSRVVG